MSLFGNILPEIIGGAGVAQQMGQITSSGELFREEAQAIGDRLQNETVFRPFSVSSGTGNVSVANDGTIDAALSSPLQAASDAALGTATGMFSAAGQPIGEAQQDVYGQLLAAMEPEQQRAQAALQQQLHAQGRGGIASNQFGGTPEQLALAKAQEEAKLNALVQARTLANQEQLQASQIGTGLLGAALSPEQSLFNQINPAHKWPYKGKN